MIFDIVRGLFVWFALLTPTLYLCWSIRELQRMRHRHAQEMERIRRDCFEMRAESLMRSEVLVRLIGKCCPSDRTPPEPNGPGDESPQATEGDPRERVEDSATVET